MIAFWVVLQVVHFPNAKGQKVFEFDEEWLGILRSTHDLMSTGREPIPLPGYAEGLMSFTHHTKEYSVGSYTTISLTLCFNGYLMNCLTCTVFWILFWVPTNSFSHIVSSRRMYVYCSIIVNLRTDRYCVMQDRHL